MLIYRYNDTKELTIQDHDYYWRYKIRCQDRLMSVPNYLWNSDSSWWLVLDGQEDYTWFHYQINIHYTDWTNKIYHTVDFMMEFDGVCMVPIERIPWIKWGWHITCLTKFPKLWSHWTRWSYPRSHVSVIRYPWSREYFSRAIVSFHIVNIDRLSWGWMALWECHSHTLFNCLFFLRERTSCDVKVCSFTGYKRRCSLCCASEER